MAWSETGMDSGPGVDPHRMGFVARKEGLVFVEEKRQADEADYFPSAARNAW